MANIKVAIQNNIRITAVSKDDNNNVDITFMQGKEMDALEALESGEGLGGADSSNVKVWSLKGDAYGEPLVGKKIVEHINQYKGFFNEILLQYFTKEEIKFGMFEGTDVKSGDDIEKLSSSEIEKVGRNIVNYFVTKMQEADKNKEVRVKFYRSSPAKNFVTLKVDMFMKFGKEQPNGFRRSWNVPFIESMDIPKSASKLEYSDYEKGVRTNGGSGNDLSDSKPAPVDNTPSGAAEVDDTFGI